MQLGSGPPENIWTPARRKAVGRIASEREVSTPTAVGVAVLAWPKAIEILQRIIAQIDRSRRKHRERVAQLVGTEERGPQPRA